MCESWRKSAEDDTRRLRDQKNRIVSLSDAGKEHLIPARPNAYTWVTARGAVTGMIAETSSTVFIGRFRVFEWSGRKPVVRHQSGKNRHYREAHQLGATWFASRRTGPPPLESQ